jgi:hypothetical protein
MLHRSPFLPTVLFLLSSCSDTTPVSPTIRADGLQEPAIGGRGHIDIKVANQVKLLDNGNLEVEARAICPRGYVREESGLLDVTQGLAAGGGSVQLHRGGCTGRWQSGTVLVFSFSDTPFSRGRARVSVTFAVVNPDDPTGEDRLQASVSRTVQIR